MQGWAEALPHAYPDPKDWDKRAEIHKRDVFRFAQQWLTEGVPYCFREEPMTFERARETMARALEESPKHISLTGSARLGYSLGEAFGAPYHDKSDFDMFVVSQKLFDHLAVDGRLFASRVKSGEAEPNNENEKKWWNDTAEKMELQITERHYIDHRLIPRRVRYPTVNRISKSIIAFERSLTVNARQQRQWSTTVRVYRDWEAAIKKIGGSMLRILKQKGYKIAGE